jgi:hypothetical protein
MCLKLIGVERSFSAISTERVRFSSAANSEAVSGRYRRIPRDSLRPLRLRAGGFSVSLKAAQYHLFSQVTAEAAMPGTAVSVLPTRRLPLVATLAAELKPIRVNGISPGCHRHTVVQLLVWRSEETGF